MIFLRKTAFPPLKKYLVPNFLLGTMKLGTDVDPFLKQILVTWGYCQVDRHLIIRQICAKVKNIFQHANIWLFM